jgi:hypothetical protein
MQNLSKLLLTLVAAAATVQPAFAHSHHHQWQCAQPGYAQSYGGNYCSPSPYPNGVRAWNGSWVDGTIGPDGNPAWAGGYRPR